MKQPDRTALRTIARKRILSLFLLLVTLCVPETRAQGSVDFEARGREFVTAMFSKEPAAAMAMMDETMSQAMPLAALEQLRDGIVGRFGAFKAITAVRVELMDSYRLAYISVDFEKSNVELRVVFDERGRVAGLQITRAG